MFPKAEDIPHRKNVWIQHWEIYWVTDYMIGLRYTWIYTNSFLRIKKTLLSSWSFCQLNDKCFILATLIHRNLSAGGAGVRADAESFPSVARAQYHLSGPSADHVTSLVGHSLKIVATTTPSYVFILFLFHLFSGHYMASCILFISFHIFRFFCFPFLFFFELSKGKASGFVVDWAL